MPRRTEHWRSLRTNNPLEGLNRELRRRTRVVGAFPDGQSALMLVAARLRHVAGTKRGLRRYMDIGRLREMDQVPAERTTKTAETRSTNMRNSMGTNYRAAPPLALAPSPTRGGGGGRSRLGCSHSIWYSRPRQATRPLQALIPTSIGRH